MKRTVKLLALLFAAAILCTTLCACNSVPANKVFSVDDLPGKKIGTQLGTTGWMFALDYEEEGSVIEGYKKGADAVLALKQGKIDCVIIDAEPAKKFVEKNDDLKILDDPFAIEEYAIAVAKENTELLANINAAIAQLKENGTIDKIISNYIGDETQGTYQYTSPEGLERPNGTLKMATNAEFEPYEYYDANQNIIGIDVDLAQAIADILGMELVVESMDFNAIIGAVQSGKADIGVAGMTVRPDRLENVNFSDSYTTSTQVIIVRKK